MDGGAIDHGFWKGAEDDIGLCIIVFRVSRLWNTTCRKIQLRPVPFLLEAPVTELWGFCTYIKLLCCFPFR